MKIRYLADLYYIGNMTFPINSKIFIYTKREALKYDKNVVCDFNFSGTFFRFENDPLQRLNHTYRHESV